MRDIKLVHSIPPLTKQCLYPKIIDNYRYLFYKTRKLQDKSKPMTLQKAKFTISPSLAVKVVEHLYKENPIEINDAIKQVEKPEPEFDYKFLLPKVLSKFCQGKGYAEEYIQGVNIGNQRKWEQTIFIALVLKLYSPGVYKGIYAIENEIRKELSGMLECNASGISHTIALVIGPGGYMNTYDEFKDQVNKYADLMKNEIKVKEVKEEAVNVTLFQ